MYILLDFVAKNDGFVDLANSILMIALKENAKDIEDIKNLSFDSSMKVSDKLLEQTGVIGEKIELSNYFLIKDEYVAGYIHPGNKLASLVGFNMSCENMQDLGKNIAMQIAAMNPLGIDESSISADIIEKEMEIGKDLARKEGKPEDMLERIATGRLKKFFKESTLINQVYIKDSKKTIMQYLTEANSNLQVVDFKRVNLG